MGMRERNEGERKAGRKGKLQRETRKGEGNGGRKVKE